MAAEMLQLLPEPAACQCAVGDPKCCSKHHPHLRTEESVAFEVDGMVGADVCEANTVQDTAVAAGRCAAFFEQSEIMLSRKTCQSFPELLPVADGHVGNIAGSPKRRHTILKQIAVDPSAGIVPGMKMVGDGGDVFDADGAELPVEVRAQFGVILPVWRQIEMDHLPRSVYAGIGAPAAGNRPLDPQGAQCCFKGSGNGVWGVGLALKSFKRRAVVRDDGFDPHTEPAQIYR